MWRIVDSQLKKQRGDTLVEVLLAMSVIGMVIGGSYAVANRNLRVGRTAREQTQALQIAEGQIEKIKHFVSLRDNTIFTASPNNTFCLSASGAPTRIASSMATPAAGCTGLQNLYTVLVTYTDPAGADNEYFDIQVMWDREGVTERGNVRMRYKIRS